MHLLQSINEQLGRFFCEKHTMMHNNEGIFSYLRTFTEKTDEVQLSLF